MRNRFSESPATLRDLMTVAPMSSKLHAELTRKRVVVRRFLEDAREEVKRRQSDLV